MSFINLSRSFQHATLSPPNTTFVFRPLALRQFWFHLPTYPVPPPPTSSPSFLPSSSSLRKVLIVDQSISLPRTA